MADAVAGVGGVGVGGVFAPGLVGLEEEGFDVGAAGVEEGAQDFSWPGAGDGDYGVDGAEALGPGSAEEFHENGLGLVVEGVGGEDGVGVAGGDEGVEEVVADGSGGFFDGLAVLGGSGGDVDAVKVEGDIEAGAEGFDEFVVGGGSSAGRMPWSTWAALRPTPRELRGVVLAASRVRRRATESAPPEMAMQMRSPGRMWVRSKGSGAGGIESMLAAVGVR